MLAQEEARLLGHSFIGTEHLLLGLLRQDGEAAHVLTDLGASLGIVRERVRETIGGGGTPTGSPPFTPRAKKVLELSLRESVQLGSHSIETQHILLGLIREGQGVACQALVGLGIDLGAVRQRAMRHLTDLRSDEDLGGSVLIRGHGEFAGGGIQARTVQCSFCGLTPPESGQVVSGDNAFICENCIRRWSARLPTRSTTVRRTLISSAPWDAVSPGEQPADPDSARREITAVFTNYGEVSEDGRAAIGIENGGDLGWALTAVRANRQQYLDAEILFTVDETIFVDPEHAAVWYSISVNGSSVLNRHRGDAVLVDGEWNIARETFRDLLGQGGITLPPE